ncbi:MAG: class II SORL domain-containing protein [Deltaproteobacteria bacterium]|nr:class II SORL domain-containing protein [Deltaproteobacteria bacterium]
MDRRSFLQTASFGSLVVGAPGLVLAAEVYFPTKVDPSIFATINRAKDPAQKTGLELSHAPVITCPAQVTAGTPFSVEVTVGEKLHPMGPAHWIESIELSVGNEPAGRTDLQPRGFLSPKVTFTLVLTKEAAPSGKVTLIARQRCNLHGYWETGVDVTVAG